MTIKSVDIMMNPDCWQNVFKKLCFFLTFYEILTLQSTGIFYPKDESIPISYFLVTEKMKYFNYT